jgi:hypothetical protein
LQIKIDEEGHVPFQGFALHALFTHLALAVVSLCLPREEGSRPKGHDAWVIGTEPAVVVDFQGMLDYAKKS